jgi:hypothetical protein
MEERHGLSRSRAVSTSWFFVIRCLVSSQVVCLLSSNRKDKYDAIKKYLCTDCPTPSQCVVARTLGKQQTVMAIATKIALQMNCKMGGELWRVDMPVSLLLSGDRAVTWLLRERCLTCGCERCATHTHAHAHAHTHTHLNDTVFTKAETGNDRGHRLLP